MATKHLIVMLFFAALMTIVLIGGAIVRTPALAQDTQPETETASAPEATVSDETKIQPVVAAIPYQTSTEYQMDPFEPGRVRSTETKTNTLILVRADGSTEIVNSR
jgi:Na+-transporting methylmalonyl-CoA/oxaloacetate decarboxylase gamma subunit